MILDMNPFKATISCLRKTFDVKTRSRRSEFWGFVLIAALTCFFLGFFDKLFFEATWPVKQTLTFRDGAVVGRGFSIGTNYGPISNICSLILLVPIISSAVRRLHDAGRRGWTLMLPIAPLAIISLSSVIMGLQTGLIIPLILVFVLLLIFIIFLLFKDSDYPNKYGPSEKYPNKGVSNPMMD